MLFCVPAAQAGAAWKYTVLHTFHGRDGSTLTSGVAVDASGNVFGTSQEGGKTGYNGGDGTVFELYPPGVGSTRWGMSLHRFNSRDGSTPIGGVTLDRAGNLYGTTVYGGKFGGGNVFTLAQSGVRTKHWDASVIHTWPSLCWSTGEMIFDASGDLYGACAVGGDIFRLTPPSGEKSFWHSTTLQNFGSSEPNGNLVLDGSGNLYGTVALDGSYGDGTVVELSPPAAGKKQWSNTVLFNFNGLNGERPEAGLISDPAGNLYGTTFFGGSSGALDEGNGVVFELSPPVSGQTAWTETVLHEFGGHDGAHTYGGVVRDASGNLYGNTNIGGTDNEGTIFELTPPSGSSTQWKRIVLHEFHGNDGEQPMAGLTMDDAGNLYGTTYTGGENEGQGTVFRLTP